MKPRRNYRRLTPLEKYFLRRHGHRVKIKDLGYLTGRNIRAAEDLRRKYSLRHSGPPISLETALEIYRHGKSVSDIRLSYDRQAFTSGQWWEEWQVTDLKLRAGREPLKDIAADLGKTEAACRKKARRMGLNPLEHTIRRLAWRLNIPIVTLAGWCRQGSGRITGYKLRHHREGRFVVVHRDDADWLLDNRDLARHGKFEDHPGKLHEYDRKESEGDE